MIIICDNPKYQMELKDLANILFSGRKKVFSSDDYLKKEFEKKMKTPFSNKRPSLEVEECLIFEKRADEVCAFVLEGEKNDVFLFLKEIKILESTSSKESSFEETSPLKGMEDSLKKMRFKVVARKSLNIDFKEKLVYKKLLYLLLKEVYETISGKWGILTGIRPVKIVNELKKEQKSEEDILDILAKNYLISSEKSTLLLDISRVQEKMIQELSNDISIYISIPFCPSRCNYCSFFSLDLNFGKQYMMDYLKTLDMEIKESLKLEFFKNKKITSIYVGGGTPSSLNEEQLEYFFEIVSSSFDLGAIKEYTFEAGRADTLNQKKLKIIKDHGVSRISINPQTMKNETLKKIGRNHSAQDVVRIFYQARELGFDDINMDLILGLTDETIEDMDRSVEEILTLDPESITIHCLAIKRASVLNQEQKKPINVEISDYMQDLTRKLYKRDYKPYYLYRQKNMLENGENIGFAKRGKYSLYNVAMMDEIQSIVGFGVGASSKLIFPDKNLIKRIPNYKDVILYNREIQHLIERKRDEFHNEVDSVDFDKMG